MAEESSKFKISSDGKEVIRIDHEGRIFWKGREVETDDEFRSAMLGLKKALEVD